MNLPLYLAIDRNEFIFVADYYNNRIVRLNSSLEYISETVGIQQPWRILLNKERVHNFIERIERVHRARSWNAITRVSRFSTFNSLN